MLFSGSDTIAQGQPTSNAVGERKVVVSRLHHSHDNTIDTKGIFGTEVCTA
jgi:hypothetical protein